MKHADAPPDELDPCALIRFLALSRRYLLQSACAADRGSLACGESALRSPSVRNIAHRETLHARAGRGAQVRSGTD
jgi:hypothetical protein